MPASDYRVRAVHCDHRAGDEEVYRALERATAPLDGAWSKLKSARRIVVKFNQAWPLDRRLYFQGHLQELVSEQVARATLRLLRENTRAELVCAEITAFDRHDEGGDRSRTITLMPLLGEFGVSFLDGDEPPHRVYAVPGGGGMFGQYLLPQGAMEGDAFVSVQKMKSHLFAGVTLCLKNLFGLAPQEPHGRSRAYFHHLVRLPYVLADLGRLFAPTLSIVDGLVAQSGREWGGQPRAADTLVAGDQVVATDACATALMGHDPAADWPTPPFHRERNALRVAAEAGFGTVNLEEVDFESEVSAPVAQFATVATDPLATVVRWRRSACEQALYYRDHRPWFVERYAGEYILLQDREVRWHAKRSDLGESRRLLAGPRADSALWLKLVDPEEVEGERFEVYERTLAQIAALGL